jgi:ABC-type cobalamin/Fe3+-siderophores transport system ATPase subunit
LLVDDPTMSLGLEETDDATPLLNSLAKERGLGVLICVADAKATAWSERAPQSPIQPASSIASTLA